jgi:hypothetical protein
VIPMERFLEMMENFCFYFDENMENMKWHLVGHKRLKFQFEGYWELSFDENVKNTKWHLVGHKRLKYQFEGYWEPCFDENVKNTKWHLVGHKRLKYQFEGYWEPSFKAFILFAWIMILFRMRKHCLPIQIACLWSERAWLGT